MRRLLLLPCALATLAFGATDADFARALKARLTEAACPIGLLGVSGAEIAALSEHHLLDLASLGGENLALAEAILHRSASVGQRTMFASYPFVEGYGDTFL